MDVLSIVCPKVPCYQDLQKKLNAQKTWTVDPFDVKTKGFKPLDIFWGHKQETLTNIKILPFKKKKYIYIYIYIIEWDFKSEYYTLFMKK